jgi:hypothetical protein
MYMEATMMVEEHDVAVARGKVRKTVTLPKDLAERIRAFWHAQQYDRESTAYVTLLEIAMELVEKDEVEKRTTGRSSLTDLLRRRRP